MSQGRVFIIDDDENSINIAKRVLERSDFEVESTTRVIGTTVMVNEFEPDIILLDIMMPALSGQRMADILHKGLHKKPKILLYSNKSEDELKKLVKETGADDYIAKINGPSAILRKVKENIKKSKES